MENESKTLSNHSRDNRNESQISTRSIIFAEHSESIKLELLNLSEANNLFLILLYALLLSISFAMGVQYSMSPNTKEKVRCYIKELENVKWSFDQKKNISSPNKDILQQGCSYYNINYSLLTNLSYEDAIEESKGMITANPLPIKCGKYLYKTNMRKEFSVIKEFNLICEQESYYFFNFFTQVGAALGAFPFGIGSDIHGRQPVFILAALITIIGGCIIPLSPSLPFFITGKMILGASSIALFLSLLVLFTEFCRNKYRSSLMLLSFIAWYLGSAVHDILLSRNIKIWRMLELARECPFLILIQSIMFIPESPRWLMCQRQLNKAWNILHLMGSTIETPAVLPHHPFVLSNCFKQSRIFIKAYFQYRTYITLILNGIACSAYYAIKAVTSYSSNQNQSDYVLIKTFMEIIFLLLMSRAAYTCSKRRICCNMFLFLAVCFIISLATNGSTVNDITLLFAEMLSKTVFIVIIIYILEIFPTSHRATALGLNLSFTQIIRIIYLYYQYELSSKMSIPVLKGFFCSFCIISALLTMLAPKTYPDIPDTKEDLIKGLTIAEQIAFSY